MTGVQSKRDSFVSNGTETHSSNVNSIRDEIKNISGRTNKLERTAEHTLSELKDLDKNKTSEIKQTAESVIQTITGAFDKYDCESYEIALSGVSNPLDDAASAYDGKYYLNQSNGYLFI